MSINPVEGDIPGHPSGDSVSRETTRFIIDVAGNEIVAKAQPRPPALPQTGQRISLNWQVSDVIVLDS
ncbi:hypothetical protein EOD23_00865 [Mesorhizobium sp. USDA-HM6]|nr:hypothetical protein EOD23_00865 [Mesorhizobium sp. USDA-HM6]